MRGTNRKTYALPSVAPEIPPLFIRPGLQKDNDSNKEVTQKHPAQYTKLQGHVENEFIMANMEQSWASSLINSNKEKENLARICWLLNDAGTSALKSSFDSIHPPLNLKEHLTQTHIRSVLQRLQEQSVLNDKQWKLLYPTKKKTVSSQYFDSRTLIQLHQNICHLCPPYPHGWSAMPLPADSSLSSDIVRLQLLYQQIAAMDTISIEKYTTIWKQAREVLLRLGGPPIRMKIHRIEHEVIAADMQTHYINTLRENWGDGSRHLMLSPTSTSSRSVKDRSIKKSKAKKFEQEGLPPEDRAVLSKTFKMFIDNIQAEDIIDRLQQNQVIKFSDRQEIFALSKNTERMHLLLNKILNSKLSYAFKALCDSIKFKYKKIHETVMQIRKETYKHGIRETVDMVGICTDALVKQYTDTYSKCTPFPWSNLTVSIRDLYTPLDIIDHNGKKIQLCDFFPPSTSKGKRGPRIVLEGPSGSGKSILRHKVSYTWATQRDYFTNEYPVLLNLDLQQVDGNIYEDMYHKLLPENFKMTTEDFFSLLEENASDVVLLIDSYDGRIKQKELEEILTGTRFTEATVIVMMNPEVVPRTSFTPDSRMGFNPDSRMFTLGYSRNNVTRCIKNYMHHFNFKIEQHQAILDAINDETWKLYPYITQPIVCLLLFAIYQSSKKANVNDISGTTSLFESYGFGMATQYCKRQKLDIIGLEFPEEVVRATDSLSNFAFQALNDDKRSFTEEEINQGTQNEIVLKLGAMIKLTPKVKWTFTCTIVHDFLAARHLSDYDMEKMIEIIKSHRMTSQAKYNDVIMFLCGLYRNDHDTHVLRSIFQEMAIENTRQTRVQSQDSQASVPGKTPRPPSGRLTDFNQSLMSFAETKFRDDVCEILAQSLPPRIILRREGLLPNKSLLALPHIMAFEGNRISHFEIHLHPVHMTQLQTYTDLATYVAKSKTLKHLKIVWSSLEIMAKFLSAFMTSAESIDSVILNDACKKATKRVTAATWATLQTGCQNMTKTRLFSFVNGKSAEVLYYVIQNLPDTIQELNFNGSSLNMMSALQLSAKLENAKALVKMDITDTGLVGSEFVNFLHGLKLSNTIKHLRLCGTKLDRAGVITLGECLKLTRTLEILDLSSCELSTDMCITLADAIVENRSLQRLVLKNTKVTNEGKEAIKHTKVNQVKVVGLNESNNALYAINLM